ncbi:DUF2066 domain-containing protein [Stutzerimonas azotifigens]|uniref:DUF2066 domain-containing protein n=1 Tax=Stutzerimonas azotifigens TaxID=291995 RepID=A0ABR5YWZ1_9GAMM|nr:DUF2066 domain-containing protein [Stutzerimonas azotifigens]MBA1272465.1 DUF2066 domain-containing protein [Stutzerimonas azotifigens]
MHMISRVLLLCLALSVLPSHAEQTRGLFQVREPVENQQSGEREQALQRAFDTLVLRLTGDEQAARSAAVGPLREDPQQLVRQYSYDGEKLVVDFDQSTVERSLRQAGLPLWGSNRPGVLAWWLYETVDGSQLVGDGQSSAALLREAGRHRGLPLHLPLADLSEQLEATPETVKASSGDALRMLSERYDADVMLAVYAHETDGSWQADWQLWDGEDRGHGKAKGDSREALADAVMLGASQFLAPRFVVAPGAVSEITLEIEGADISRFAELDKLVEPFGGRLLRIDDDMLVYRLNASPEQLRSQLALARLREVEIPKEPIVEPNDELQVEADGATQVAPGDVAPGVNQPPAPPAEVDRGTVMRFSW